MGKFVTGYGDDRKAQYQYVYGKTYEEAENKVLIGREIATRFLSCRYITVGKVYREWLNAVVNRVKESTLANYINGEAENVTVRDINVTTTDASAWRCALCRPDRWQDKCLYK